MQKLTGFGSLPNCLFPILSSYLTLKDACAFARVSQLMFLQLQSEPFVAEALNNTPLSIESSRILTVAAEKAASLTRIWFDCAKRVGKGQKKQSRFSRSSAEISSDSKGKSRIDPLVSIIARSIKIEAVSIKTRALTDLSLQECEALVAALAHCAALKIFSCHLKQELFVKKPACLSSYVGLTALCINSAIRDESVAEFAKLPLLERLELVDCQALTKNGFESIAKIAKLHFLRLQSVQEGEKGGIIAKLQLLEEVEVLQLSGFFHILSGAIPCFANLRFLEFCGAKIASLDLLNFTTNHPHLHYLMLEGPHLTDEDLISIADRCLALRWIKLHNIRPVNSKSISPAVFRAFVKLECLEGLSLNEDINRKNLEILLSSRSLKFLDVGENHCYQPSTPSKIKIRSRGNAQRVKPFGQNIKKLSLF